MTDVGQKLFLFHQGTYYRAYEFMGCHLVEGGAVFRVWAPNARCVSVIGDFNGWDIGAHPMQKISDGVWEVVVAGAQLWHSYKYFVTTQSGDGLYKSDPYGFNHDCYGDKASRVVDIDNFQWTDDRYMAQRQARVQSPHPINIYEAHIGSWRRNDDGSFFGYRQFADQIVPYLLDMSYTHIELVGIAEYPFDPSWGYQVTGYFAPTSRYGAPEDFAYLVDRCHAAGIGVILDWVPGHFPKDANGLYCFDGSNCYEHPSPLRGEHKEWGTLCFDYGRCEVQTFLVSNAVYWLDKYHIDGLRVDAVASMLYLDYGRHDGEWEPNSYGGRENLESIAFLRKFNDAVHSLHPGVLTIAEESTAWPMVTCPPCDGGLGFDLKWNMGWMNDNLSYVRIDPLWRQYHHNQLTFTMMYAFSENFILPISHDEVVYGKGSLLNKMHGDIWDKFAQLRIFLMNMYAHPGKKLLFMGSEFGQFAEWNYQRGLDFFLIDQYDTHRQTHDFARNLFATYRHIPAFWALDRGWDGYQWLVTDDNHNNVIAYQSTDAEGNRIVAVFNWSPMTHDAYCIGVDRGSFVRILNTNRDGWDTDAVKIRSAPVPMHGRKHSLTLDLAPWAGMYLFCPATKKKAPRAQGVAARST